MNEKSESSQFLMDFYAMADTQFGGEVKIVRRDNGYEFTSNPMKKVYREKGIIHQTSCIDTRQQSGKVERKHRHILCVARALRFLLLFFKEKFYMKFCSKSSLPMIICVFLGHYVMLIIFIGQRINWS